MWSLQPRRPFPSSGSPPLAQPRAWMNSELQVILADSSHPGGSVRAEVETAAPDLSAPHFSSFSSG